MMATKLMSVGLVMDVVSALFLSERLTEVGKLRSQSTPSQSLIICPFLGVMIQEGFLPVQDSYTREELQNLTETAGLPSSVAELHTASNFKDIPSGTIDIFSMEGLPNEHKTSTGIHDCATLYHDCKHSNGIYTCESEVDIVGFKSCQAALPNSVKFEDFWSVADANSDNILTRAELEAGDEFYSVVDANPIASGDIVGSFGFILDVFGSGGGISKQDLQRVFIERRSPSHYVFGRPAATGGDGDGRRRRRRETGANRGGSRR
jgi:hypothetical protein